MTTLETIEHVMAQGDLPSEELISKLCMEKRAQEKALKSLTGAAWAAAKEMKRWSAGNHAAVNLRNVLASIGIKSSETPPANQNTVKAVVRPKPL